MQWDILELDVAALNKKFQNLIQGYQKISEDYSSRPEVFIFWALALNELFLCRSASLFNKTIFQL